jgi:hypothetical protein
MRCCMGCWQHTDQSMEATPEDHAKEICHKDVGNTNIKTLKCPTANLAWENSN